MRWAMPPTCSSCSGWVRCEIELTLIVWEESSVCVGFPLCVSPPQLSPPDRTCIGRRRFSAARDDALQPVLLLTGEKREIRAKGRLPKNSRKRMEELGARRLFEPWDFVYSSIPRPPEFLGVCLRSWLGWGADWLKGTTDVVAALDQHSGWSRPFCGSTLNVSQCVCRKYWRRRSHTNIQASLLAIISIFDFLNVY